MRVLKFVMILLVLLACFPAMATAMGVWQALQGESPWAAVGLLAGLTAALLLPAYLLERVGRHLSGGRSDW